MKHLGGIALLLLSSSTFAIEKDVVPDTCLSPVACISRIYEVLDRSGSPSQYPSIKEQAIIKRLLEFGEDAMPLIVQLIEDDDEHIAKIGSVTLRETKSIDEKYLPQIVKGLENNVSWLAPALANIGTPEAAEIAVKKYLVSDSSPHNQEGFALILFGKKALPTIIKAAKCEYGCNNKTYYLLGYALGELEENRVDAARLLVDVVQDTSLSVEVRQGVLYMISFLDKPGLVIEDDLLRIRQTEAQLTDAVNRALIGIESTHSGKIYAYMLADGIDRYMLLDLARLGASGNEAGASIIGFLDSDDMEKRLLAARTLGFIKYTQAAPKLIELLTEPSDVQLNWVAAESLGRMKSEIAIPTLKNTAESHWYPPVREAANNAIDHIKSDSVYESKFNKDNFAFDYFSYKYIGLKSCENITLATKREPEDQKLYKSHAKKKLESLVYKSVKLSFGPKDEAQKKLINPDGIIEESDIVKYRKEIKQVPHVALRVEGGWLAGSNRGEWGGELVHISDNGKVTKILDENIENIYKLDYRYITTVGLSHLGLNQGMIYELYQDAGGYWRKREWLKLPGAPRSSWFVETGEILINTNGGGSILLSKSGSMRMANCR